MIFRNTDNSLLFTYDNSSCKEIIIFYSVGFQVAYYLGLMKKRSSLLSLEGEKVNGNLAFDCINDILPIPISPSV